MCPKCFVSPKWLRGHIYSGVDRLKKNSRDESATNLLNGAVNSQSLTCNRQNLCEKLKRKNDANNVWSPPTATRNDERDSSVSPQCAKTPTRPSKRRRRCAAAATAAKPPRQLPIDGHSAFRQASRDLQFQGDVVKPRNGSSRSDSPISTSTDATAKRLRPRRRGCGQRHPREILYTRDDQKKCARTTKTPKTPSIAFPIRRSASAASTTNWVRQLRIVGHSALRKTPEDLQLQVDLDWLDIGAARRRSPISTPSTTTSERVEPRRRGHAHRQHLGPLYASITCRTILTTIRSPKTPSTAVPAASQLPLQYARRARATQAGSEM